MHAPAGRWFRIRSGCVAVFGLMECGDEVLLGLLGPGHVVWTNPEHPVRMVAHAASCLEPFDGDPSMALRQRLELQEQWSSAQGCTHLPDRTLRILALLAAEFGRPAPGGGVLVDVRLTHAQLAAAVGASRAAVTRALGQLVRRGEVEVLGRGSSHRYVLHVAAGAHRASA